MNLKGLIVQVLAVSNSTTDASNCFLIHKGSLIYGRLSSSLWNHL